MKSDVLSSIGKLLVCTSYTIDGEQVDFFPYDITSKDITPNYIEIKGWVDKDDIEGLVWAAAQKGKRI